MSSLSITVLGATAPYPRPGRACSGHLIRAGDGAVQVWVDAGPGTLANLQRHTSPDRLSAIWLSHMHADHSADLLTCYYALAYTDLRPERRIPVFGPSGWAERMSVFLGGMSAPSPIERVFEVHELSDGHRTELYGLRLTSMAMEHDVESYGLRAEYGGRKIAYSGDTRPCPALEKLATGTDIFVCEADSDDPAEWHCTPEDAGAAARGAGPGRLIITHVGPTLTPAGARERAAAIFDGPVVDAREGAVHQA